MLRLTLGRPLRRAPRILPALFATLSLGCGLSMSSEDRLDRAAEALENGDYRAAIIDAKDVLREQPNNVRGRLLLAQASIAVNDWGAAEKELQRSIELGTARNEVIVDLAYAILRQSKFQQLVDEILVDPTMSDDVVVWINKLRADAYLGLNQPALARELYSSVLDAEPENVDAQLGVVSSYVAEKNVEQARAILDQIITSEPDSTRVWLASGSLNLQLRAYERAQADFEAALEQAERRDDLVSEAQALSGLAEALLAQEKSDRAREIVMRLAASAPNSLPASILEARIASIDSDWAKAQQLLHHVLQASPGNLTAQMLLGAVQLKVGNLGQAEMYLSAVVSAAPENREARRLLAEARLQLQRADEAQDALRPIVSGNDADARSLSLAARASIGQGDYGKAIRYLEHSLSTMPGDTELQFQLAATYLGAGRISEAERTLNNMSLGGSEKDAFRKDSLWVLALLREGDKREALESAQLMVDKYPDIVAAYNLLGSVEMMQADYAAARSTFDKALEIEPGDIVAPRLLASLDEVESDFQAAAGRYSSILNRNPNATWAMYSLARIAARNEDLAGARDWLEKIRELDIRAVQPRLALSRLAINADEYAEAAEILNEVLEQDSTNAEAHNLLGLSKLKQRQISGAINSFRIAADLDTENSLYRVNLALAQRQQGDLAGAMRTLEDASSRGLTDIRSSVVRASLKVEEGDQSGALEIAERLQEIHPDSGAPHVLEAEIHWRAGNLLEASNAYDRALTIETVSGHAIRAFEVKKSLGLADANAPLLQLLGERPLDNEIRLILAAYYGTRDQIRESIAEYEKVLRNDPANTTALNNLAWSFQQIGDQRAEATARRAYELMPDNASIVDTLGWILVGKGSFEEGEKLLRKAVRLSDGRPQIKYHLAVALTKSGNADEARNVLTQILGGEQDFSSRGDAEKLLAKL